MICSGSLPEGDKAPTEEKTEKEEPVPPVSNAAIRFWEQYPKPKNLLQRRATVSGASPTSTRPPVTFVDVISILFNSSCISLCCYRVTCRA